MSWGLVQERVHRPLHVSPAMPTACGEASNVRQVGSPTTPSPQSASASLYLNVSGTIAASDVATQVFQQHGIKVVAEGRPGVGPRPTESQHCAGDCASPNPRTPIVSFSWPAFRWPSSSIDAQGPNWYPTKGLFLSPTTSPATPVATAPIFGDYIKGHVTTHHLVDFVPGAQGPVGGPMRAPPPRLTFWKMLTKPVHRPYGHRRLQNEVRWMGPPTSPQSTIALQPRSSATWPGHSDQPHTRPLHAGRWRRQFLRPPGDMGVTLKWPARRPRPGAVLPFNKEYLYQVGPRADGGPGPSA